MEPVFHHESSNLWSLFPLILCSWGHLTPGTCWVPVALPSLLPEQITEAVLPWEQSGSPRAVTAHSHRKDSSPQQWNRAFQSWSFPSAPSGVEMATPQPSWRQTTLALARLQWEAQSTLHRPEIFISTRPSHWEELFVMSRTSVYAGRKKEKTKQSKISAKSHDFLPPTECAGRLSPDLHLTWTDNLNSSTVVARAP